jgi:poly-beta-1,6-N-acetyl-D-glucosamine synthase
MNCNLSEIMPGSRLTGAEPRDALLPGAPPARLVLLMPMRNEIATIETTLLSLIKQTVLPDLLLVLADGVSDGSDKDVERYARRHPWIQMVRLPDRGYDLVGQGVAQVLNYGLRQVSERPSTYIGKFDADLDLPPDYLERVLALFESDPILGMASGHPYTFENGRKLLERHGDRFPSGTARIYRRGYLHEIGDWVNSVGWDTVDILGMRMREYRVQVLHDLQYHHIRRMGTRNGYMDGMIRDGRNAYLTGYAPWFLVLRAVFNGIYRPYLLRTACMLTGYFKAMIRKSERVVSGDEMRFHRRLHRQRFLRLRFFQP